MLCNEARAFKAAVAVPSGRDALQVKRVVEREDGSIHDGECLLGDLTDVGRQSTHNLGAALRKLYVEKLGFLPDVVQNEAEVYLRSTNLPRTIESLQQVTHGLYPTMKQGKDFIANIRIRNPQNENLFGNTGACERLKVLMISFAKAAAVAYNPTLEPLDDKLSKFIEGKPVRLDGTPRASGILDTVRATTAHGVNIPAELQEKQNIDLIEAAVVAEWFAAYKNEEVKRLGFGRLLNEIVQKMKKKAARQDEDPLKILIHSTHDTAIAGLTQTLGVFDDKWPPFTSSITFELFKQKSSANDSPYMQKLLSSLTAPVLPQKHYVRMRFQNKDMILPACQEAGKHLEGYPAFCTLEAFSQRVKELTPVDSKAECAVV